MRRRLGLLVLCSVLLAGAGACSSDGDSADASAGDASATATGGSRTPDPDDPITFADTTGGYEATEVTWDDGEPGVSRWHDRLEVGPDC